VALEWAHWGLVQNYGIGQQLCNTSECTTQSIKIENLTIDEGKYRKIPLQNVVEDVVAVSVIPYMMVKYGRCW